jgi:general secretion pathway protein M
MTPTLSPLVSRALALALLFALVSLVLTSIVLPLLDAYRTAVASAQQLQNAIDHARTSGDNVAALRAEVAKRKGLEQSAPGYLRSSNEALAAAELQERLKTATATVHADLRSTQTLPPRDEANARRITVRGELAADVAALQTLFYVLESGSPMLFLDNVDIGGTTPKIMVRFDLYGYVRSAS